MRLALIAFLFCFQALAQHSDQPLKESNSDLRSTAVMFSLEEVKTGKVYWLERTANHDFFLRMREGEKKEGLLKISSRDARKLEQDFASRFLKIQYEIPSVPGDCKVTLRLTLKGDGQEVCRKDDKRTQEIKPFLDGITQRF